MNNKRNIPLDNNYTKNRLATTKKEKLDSNAHINIPSSLSSQSEAEIIIIKLKDNKKNVKNESNKLEILENKNFQQIEKEEKNWYINNEIDIINYEKLLNNDNISTAEKNANKSIIKTGAKSASNLINSNNKVIKNSNEIYNQKYKDTNKKTRLITKLIPNNAKNNILNIIKTESNFGSMIDQKKKKLFHSFHGNFVPIKTNDTEYTAQKIENDEINEDNKFIKKSAKELKKMKIKKINENIFKGEKIIKGNVNNKLFQTLSQRNTAKNKNPFVNNFSKMRINISGNNITDINKYYSSVSSCKNKNISKNNIFKIQTNDRIFQNSSEKNNDLSHILKKKLLNDGNIKKDDVIKNKITHRNSALKNKYIFTTEDNNLEKTENLSSKIENKKINENLVNNNNKKLSHKQMSKKILKKQNYETLFNESNGKILTNRTNVAKKTIFQKYSIIKNANKENEFNSQNTLIENLKQNNFSKIDNDNNIYIKENSLIDNNIRYTYNNIIDVNKTNRGNISDTKGYHFLKKGNKFHDLLQCVIPNGKEIRKENYNELFKNSKTINIDNLKKENKNIINNNCKKSSKKYKFVEKNNSKDKDLTEKYYELYKKTFNDTDNIEQKYSFKPKSKQNIKINNKKHSPDPSNELIQKYPTYSDNNILIYKNDDSKKYYDFSSIERETNKSFILDLNNSIPIDEKALYQAFTSTTYNDENNDLKINIDEKKKIDYVEEKIKNDFINDEKENIFNNEINKLYEIRRNKSKKDEISNDEIKIYNLKKDNFIKRKIKSNVSLNENINITKEKAKKTEKKILLKNFDCNRNTAKSGRKTNRVIKHGALVFENSKLAKNSEITEKNSKTKYLEYNKYYDILSFDNKIL